MASYNDAKLNGWNSGADSSTNQAMKLFTEAVVSQMSDKVTSQQEILHLGSNNGPTSLSLEIDGISKDK
ncbi:hypothetical protein CMK14_09520 [Candidatus Poribacteria bacterium]|nr:hypothetical protein [Candidatus Poribacteria bacterium]